MLSKYILNRIINYINHIPNLIKLSDIINKNSYNKSHELYKNGCKRVPTTINSYKCMFCAYINCKCWCDPHENGPYV